MKSSIHFATAKPTSQIHNLRQKEFSYVREDLKETNFSFGSTVKHSVIIKELKAIVKEKTGRTAQEKAVFIKEGVFLIKPEHTNEQLQKVAQDFAAEFGVKLLELHVHRDEGHWKDKKNKIDWKPNLHAHLLIENIDRSTGKTPRWSIPDLRKIQDFFAERLEMERGKKSNKKHINSVEYKIQKLEKELEDLKITTEREKIAYQNEIEKTKNEYRAVFDDLSELKATKEEIIEELEKKVPNALEMLLLQEKAILWSMHSDYLKELKTPPQRMDYVIKHESFEGYKAIKEARISMEKTTTKISEEVEKNKIKRKF